MQARARPTAAQFRRRRLTIAALTSALFACIGLLLASALSGAGPRVASARDTSTLPTADTTASTSGATTSAPLVATTTTSSPTTTTSFDATQTEVLPSATGAHFDAVVASLWRGVTSGSPTAAGGAFFPEPSYVALKAISWAAADFTDRLLVEFHNDLLATHDALGSDAMHARFLKVIVDEQFAHWIAPNECYNRDGYFEVPNSRVVYELDGRIASFGIASMISWRGEWYVVHLGAVLRSSTAGVVDDPQTGSGVPTYSSTC